MSKTKSRTKKKYNRTRVLRVELDRILKDVVIVSVQPKDAPKAKCHVMRYSSQKFIPVNLDLANALCELSFPWTIYCAVIGTTQLGEDYLQNEELHATNRYMQRDLQPLAEQTHARLIKEFNSMHYKGAAWIASPVPREIDDGIATEILTKLKAWDAHERTDETTVSPEAA